jgi:selenocysteine lyase/cysteine desulfurase
MMQKKPIYYFNNAATSWPKPNSVVLSLPEFLNKPPSDSARHCNCVRTDEDTDIKCKNKISNFLNINTENYDITLTCGSTYSANIVINWLSKKYDNIQLLTDSSNHNSIYRTHYEKIGTNPVIIEWDWLINNSNKLLSYNSNYYCVITHTNNVDGNTLSDDKIIQILNILKPYNIPVIIDITQSAGTYDIDISKYNYDNLYIICSGHKGLFSITGIGFLIHPKKSIDIPLISGGTGGINGIDYEHTNSLEAGTPNEIAMNTLIEGILSISAITTKYIRYKKSQLYNYFIDNYKTISEKFKNIFDIVPSKNPESGIVCLKILDKQKSEEIIQKITENGFMVRSGVHCSPLYHINILQCDSTFRLSFSMFNLQEDILEFINLLKTI